MRVPEHPFGSLPMFAHSDISLFSALRKPLGTLLTSFAVPTDPINARPSDVRAVGTRVAGIVAPTVRVSGVRLVLARVAEEFVATNGFSALTLVNAATGRPSFLCSPAPNTSRGLEEGVVTPDPPHHAGVSGLDVSAALCQEATHAVKCFVGVHDACSSFARLMHALQMPRPWMVTLTGRLHAQQRVAWIPSRTLLMRTDMNRTFRECLSSAPRPPKHSAGKISLQSAGKYGETYKSHPKRTNRQ